MSSFTDWTSGERNLVYDAAQPLFTDAANGDYTLADGSQAINRGNNQYVDATTTVDLAGNARIVGGTVDLGAYEYQTASSAVLESGDELFDELDEDDYDLLAVNFLD